MKNLLLGLLFLLITTSVGAVETTYLLYSQPINTYTYPTSQPYYVGTNAPVNERGNMLTTGFPGWFTGMRYYKLPGVTGTVTGHVWDFSTHALLATTTFVNETPSGWQTALFRTITCVSGTGPSGSCAPGQIELSFPAAIRADPGVTYIVSYSASTPRNIAMGDTVSFGPLNTFPLSSAQSDGLTIFNGTYGAANVFPATPGGNVSPATSSGFLFFVDVMFKPGFCQTSGGCTSTPTDSSLAPKFHEDTTVHGSVETELGMLFHPTQDGYVYALKIWKSSAATGSPVMSLWDSSGVLLAQASTTFVPGSGWYWVYLSTPVQLKGGTNYTVSWHRSPNVDYASYGVVYPLASRDNNSFPFLSATNCMSKVTNTPSMPNVDCGLFNYGIDVVFSPLSTH